MYTPRVQYGYDRPGNGAKIAVVFTVVGLLAIVIVAIATSGSAPADPIQVSQTTIQGMHWTVVGELKVVDDTVVGKVDYGSKHCQLEVTAPASNAADVTVHFSGQVQRRIRSLSYSRAIQNPQAYGRGDCV